MSSLRMTAWGFILVALDFRIDGFDVLLDPVGWALAVVSLSRLRGHHRAFGAAAAACGFGFAVSLLGVAAEPSSGLTSVESVVQTAVVFATCTGIVGTVPGRAESANVIRWLDLALVVLVTGGAYLVDEADVDELVPAVVGLGVAVLAVAIWFVVLLFRTASTAPVAERVAV